MIRNLRIFLAAALLSVSLVSSAQERLLRRPAAEMPYTVDEYGYATYQYMGFTFKMKENYISTEYGRKGIERMMDDLEKISSIIPQDALKVMRSRAIWMEENNVHNRSAAWYHTSADYPSSIGDISAKGKCLEITNIEKYVNTTAKNQPFMVLHELCHLYHDQALGGNGNKDIHAAYLNAKEKGLYKTYWRRGDVANTAATETTYYENEKEHCYCMNNDFEFFAEMCEAYWGENDYFPYDNGDLRNFDPVAYELMEKIWKRK